MTNEPYSKIGYMGGVFIGLLMYLVTLFAGGYLFSKFEGGDMRGIGIVFWFGLAQLPLTLGAALACRWAGAPNASRGLVFMAALALLLWGGCRGVMWSNKIL